MTENSRILGEAIKKARSELDLTQEEVADKSGVDIRTIINIEKNRGNPKFESLYPLVNALQIDARELFSANPQSDCPAKHRLHLLIDKCDNDDIPVLLSVLNSVISALHSKDGIEVK